MKGLYHPYGEGEADEDDRVLPSQPISFHGGRTQGIAHITKHLLNGHVCVLPMTRQVRSASQRVSAWTER